MVAPYFLDPSYFLGTMQREETLKLGFSWVKKSVFIRAALFFAAHNNAFF